MYVSCPCRWRYWKSALSWGIRTPSNFASIAPFSRRQHDPQHQAGMWRSRVLGQLGVLDAAISPGCSLLSRQTIPAFIGARFHTQRRPCAVQPRSAMSSFEPRLARRCYRGQFLLPYVIWGLWWGCLCLHPSGSPTSGLPPPLAHVKDWLDVPNKKLGVTPTTQVIFVQRALILGVLRNDHFAQYFAVGLSACHQQSLLLHTGRHFRHV